MNNEIIGREYVLVDFDCARAHDRVGMKDTSGAIKTVIQDPLSMSCVEIEFRFITLEILFVYLSLVSYLLSTVSLLCVCSSSFFLFRCNSTKVQYVVLFNSFNSFSSLYLTIM